MSENKNLKSIAEIYKSDKIEHGYIEIYESYFEKIRDEKLKIFEIGIADGKSLLTWADYFKNSTIIGIDIHKINPIEKKLNKNNIEIHQGSQSDKYFIEELISKYKEFDIIIDDGSHQSEHIIASFETLAKHVRDGGLYIVEDVHACYWKGFRGDSDSSNALSYFLGLAHSLNTQATRHERCSKNLSPDELVTPPALIRKIELLPSMIICHMGVPLPMIEWKAGMKSVII